MIGKNFRRIISSGLFGFTTVLKKKEINITETLIFTIYDYIQTLKQKTFSLKEFTEIQTSFLIGISILKDMPMIEKFDYMNYGLSIWKDLFQSQYKNLSNYLNSTIGNTLNSFLMYNLIISTYSFYPQNLEALINSYIDSLQKYYPELIKKNFSVKLFNIDIDIVLSTSLKLLDYLQIYQEGFQKNIKSHQTLLEAWSFFAWEGLLDKEAFSQLLTFLNKMHNRIKDVKIEFNLSNIAIFQNELLTFLDKIYQELVFQKFDPFDSISKYKLSEESNIIKEWNLFLNIMYFVDKNSQFPKEIISNHILSKKDDVTIAEDDIKNPFEYIKKLLSFYKKYVYIESFVIDLQVQRGLLIGMTEIMNIYSKELNISKYHIISSALNQLLIEKSLDIESRLNQILFLLKFCKEKDLFITLYENNLSKRLLYKMSDHNLEKFTLNIIKEYYGIQYVRRSFNMIQQVIDTETITKNYHEVYQKNDQSSFYILSSNCWSFDVSKSLNLKSIPLIENSLLSFKDFYNMIHPERILKWVFHISSCELKYQCEKSFILKCSLPQAAILSCFNENEKMKLDKFIEITNLKELETTQILNAFSKKGAILPILKLEKDEFILNTDFNQNKNLKIVYNMPSKDKNIHIDMSKINKQREISIQAAIVKIMKTKKKMFNNELVSNVIKYIGSHFSPNITMIKNCIDQLQLEGYIERSENDRNLFHYIS